VVSQVDKQVRMYFCYLLRSDRTPTSKATYVGFSVDPLHRLRQHNGEITSGAWRTSRYRPWKHIAIVGGFPSHITALQFEWQWQHPEKSRIPDLDGSVRGAGHRRLFIVLSRLFKTRLWKQLNLVVYFFAEDMCSEFVKLLGGERVNVQITTREQFEAARKALKQQLTQQATVEVLCSMCGTSNEDDKRWLWTCVGCANSCHLTCLASNMGSASIQRNFSSVLSASTGNLTDFVSSSSSAVSRDHTSSDSAMLPQSAACPRCSTTLEWSTVVRQSRRSSTGNESAAVEKELAELEADECKQSDSESDSEHSVLIDDSAVSSPVCIAKETANGFVPTNVYAMRDDIEIIVLD
jgi:structure-specific endonuclease subunit SLX1